MGIIPPDHMWAYIDGQESWSVLGPACAQALTRQLGRDASLRRVLVVEAVDARPVQGALAHRAGCRRRVHVAIGEIAFVQPAGRITDCEQLRVSRGIAL